MDGTSLIITYSDLPYFIHRFQDFSKTTRPLSIYTKQKFSLQLMTNCLSLIYLLMIACTYNQPSTTSKNHQDPKHHQKLQPKLVSLASLLDLLLLPMITLPNHLTPSITIFPNSSHKYHHTPTISSHKCTPTLV
jgi:hypothetical protein